jgi:hypothetical protein
MGSVLWALFPALVVTAWTDAAPAPLPTGVEVHAQVQLPDHALTVGDPFTYTVQVTCPAGVSVFLPDPGASLAPLEVRDVQQSSTPLGDRQQILVSLQLAAFSPGEVTIPTIHLQYAAPGAAPVSLPVAGSKVTITSVLPPNAQDIRDIREPFGKQEKAQTFRWWLVVGVGLAAAVVAWWVRNRGKARRDLLASRPETAHERALSALEALGGLRLDDPDSLQAYYTGLSTVVREFLEARYAVRAMEATTRMIRWELEARSVPAQWRERVCNLLARADLVKFARQMVTPEQATDDLEEARQAVLEVVPTPEATGEVKPASAH